MDEGTKELARAAVEVETSMESMLEQIKNLKEKIRQDAKPEVLKWFKGIFNKNTHFARIHWTQYTPYFNDGDTCTFGLHRFGIAVTDEFSQANNLPISGGGDYDDGYWSSSWDFSWLTSERNTDRTTLTDAQKEALRLFGEEIERIKGLWNEGEELFETAFGDHAAVTIHRNGQLEVSDYDHD